MTEQKTAKTMGILYKWYPMTFAFYKEDTNSVCLKKSQADFVKTSMGQGVKNADI